MPPVSTHARSFGVRRAAAVGLLLGLLALLVRVTGSATLERADFVLNNGTEVSTLDPASVSGVPEGRVMYALYEGLTVRDKRTLESVPGMAEAWELSDDGLTYTFHIRKNARWSNGDPLTARDFEWSWQRLLHPETASEYSYQLWYVAFAEEYSLSPADTPGDRWWFDETYWVNWNEDRESVRVGIHSFAPESTTRPVPVDTDDSERGSVLPAHDADLRFRGRAATAQYGLGDGRSLRRGLDSRSIHIAGPIAKVPERLPP